MTLDATAAAHCAAQIWKTRDGRTLKWSEMTEAHLRNSARHLRERKDDRAIELLRTITSVQGEHARDDLDAELDRVSDEMVLIERYAMLMDAYANWRAAGHT